MSGERKDVVGSLPQRRQVQTNTIQSMVEIRPEAAVSHGFLEVAIGRGKDAQIDLLGLRVTDGTESSILKESQELDLNGGGISPISSRKSVPP